MRKKTDFQTVQPGILLCEPGLWALALEVAREAGLSRSAYNRRALKRLLRDRAKPGDGIDWGER